MPYACLLLFFSSLSIVLLECCNLFKMLRYSNDQHKNEPLIFYHPKCLVGVSEVAGFPALRPEGKQVDRSINQAIDRSVSQLTCDRQLVCVWSSEWDQSDLDQSKDQNLQTGILQAEVLRVMRVSGPVCPLNGNNVCMRVCV